MLLRLPLVLLLPAARFCSVLRRWASEDERERLRWLLGLLRLLSLPCVLDVWRERRELRVVLVGVLVHVRIVSLRDSDAPDAERDRDRERER